MSPSMRTSNVEDGRAGMVSNPGDQEARFDRIFDEHARAVLAYCLRRSSPADANDALSEVFVVVWRRLDVVPATGTRPWLYGVARRVLANQRRSAGRREKLADVIRLDRPAAAPAAETISIGRSQDQIVSDAVQRLPESDREVLTLIAWEGLTRAEAAEVVGCSPEAAKKRYQRALSRLREDLATVVEAAGPDPRSAPEGGD